MHGTLSARKIDRTIKIRNAGYRDVDVVADFGARFFKESGLSDVMQWDRGSAIATAESLIDNDGGILLVCLKGGDHVGMAGGLVHPSYFNHDHLTGQELFWWVDPAHRSGVGGQLLDALENAARKLGARTWNMIALQALRPDIVGKTYERRGYMPLEHSYIKALV